MNEFNIKKQKKERDGYSVQDAINSAMKHIDNTENIVIVMSSRPDEQGFRDIHRFSSFDDDMAVIGLLEYAKVSNVTDIEFGE